MSTALVSGIFNNDLSRCPLLLLQFTDISQELRTHFIGGIQFLLKQTEVMFMSMNYFE